jgi:hypothetical protein
MTDRRKARHVEACRRLKSLGLLRIGIRVTGVFPRGIDMAMIVADPRVPRISKNVPPSKWPRRSWARSSTNHADIVVPRLNRVLPYADLLSPQARRAGDHTAPLTDPQNPALARGRTEGRLDAHPHARVCVRRQQ